MKRLSIAPLLAAAWTLAGTASAQDLSSTVASEETPALKRTTVELRPLEVLVSAVPGIAAAGASVEGYVARNFAAFVDGAYYDVNLSGRQRDVAEGESNEPVIDTGYGFSAGLGLRVYDDPIGDSAYAAALLSYRELHGTWEYEDETLTARQFAAIPSVALGYRWVWSSGFLLRAGVGAGLPSVPSQHVSSNAAAVATPIIGATDGEEKLDDMLDQKTIVTADLGLGWMF